MVNNKFNLSLVISVIIIFIGFLLLKDGFKAQGSEPSVDVQMDVLNYLEYSESSLDLSKNKGDTLLFFAATLWCQTCSELEKEIMARHAEIPDDITILKVDYDNDSEMNANWGVTSQHTLILLDEKGQEVKRWIGGGFDAMIQQIEKV